MNRLPSYRMSRFLLGLGTGVLVGAVASRLAYRQPSHSLVDRLDSLDLRVGHSTYDDFRNAIVKRIETGSAVISRGLEIEPAAPSYLVAIGNRVYYFNMDDKLLGILPQPPNTNPVDMFEQFANSDAATLARELFPTKPDN